MKIDLPLHTTSGWITLSAEIVDVAPHVADIATFAIHRQTEAIRFLPHGWSISNVETGFSARACDAVSRADCLRKARQYLGSKSRQQIMKALSKGSA